MASSSFALFPVIMWLGMFGMPLGVPPLPEDPMMAKIAPQECLFYLSSAGVAEADAKSSNRVEQLLAEPEVKRMTAEIENAVKAALEKAMSRPSGGIPGVTADEAAMLGKLFLASPKAIYLADLQVQPGKSPRIRGGLIVGLGDAAEKVRSIAEKALAQGPFQKSESEGATWYQFQPAPDAPVFKFGVKGKYFVLGAGEGEVEAMLQRAQGTPPAWLEKIARDLPVERRSTVQYVNVKKLRDTLLVLAAGPQGMIVAEALGLHNVTAIVAATGLDKAEFVSRSQIEIDGQPQGIFSPVNSKPLTLADAAALPADATIAVAVRFDPQKIYETFLTIAEKIDLQQKAQIVESMKQLQAALGMKMPDDLLAPFGDTLCLYDSPSEGGLGLGLTAVVKVKDSAKAKAALEKLTNILQGQRKAVEQPNTVAQMMAHNIEKAGGMRPVTSLEKIEFAGKEIYSLNLSPQSVFVAPAWCLTDGELIVALFPQSIKAYLSRSENFRSLADSPEMKQAIGGESGTLAVGYCDTTRLFDQIYPWALVFIKTMTIALQREGIDLNMAMFPSAQSIRGHLSPGVFTVRRTKAGVEISERTSLPGVALTTSAPMAVALMLPAVQSAREAARRAQSVNNMKQIALAMHNYHDARRTFPPAFKADKDGKPLLSWRVLILPYLEEDNLYNQFKLDEPWDSEHNKKLIDKMPAVYKSPTSTKSAEGKTNYLTVRGEKTIFSDGKGKRIADISDGSSHTIMTVEVDDEKAVLWTKPDDFEYDENNPVKGLGGLHPGLFLAGFADGSVRVIANSIDATVLKALFTRNGREVIDQNQIP
jgi:hypothetical protein